MRRGPRTPLDRVSVRTVASCAEMVTVAGSAWTTVAEPMVLLFSVVMGWAVSVSTAWPTVCSNLLAREPQAGQGGRLSGSKVGASSSFAPQALQ